MPSVEGTEGGAPTKTGGFLLGTELSVYQDFIRNSYSLTAENHNQIVGFGIVLPFEVVKQTEIWNKRQFADWYPDPEKRDLTNVCYFEQLAFLKGNRRLALALSYNLINYAFKKGHKALLTTTVNKPIQNLAAVPFIKAVNGKKVGNIDEIYPGTGNINSDIYMIEREAYYSAIRDLSSFPWLQSKEIYPE